MPDYVIHVATGPETSEADRNRLTSDLEQVLIGAGIPRDAIARRSQDPGREMAAGTILSLETLAQIGGKVLEVLRSWLASRRTEVEIEGPDGRKIKLSAANFDEAAALLDRTGWSRDRA